MRLLLDTHIAIWALTDDRRLSKQARIHIEDPDNRVFVSAATIWEIAIKHSLGRFGVPFSAHDALGYFAQAGYEWLAIRPSHTAATQTLPPLHTDPFDRLLIAQALTDPLRLMTHDKSLAAYSETILLV